VHLNVKSFEIKFEIFFLGWNFFSGLEPSIRGFNKSFCGFIRRQRQQKFPGQDDSQFILSVFLANLKKLFFAQKLSFEKKNSRGKRESRFSGLDFAKTAKVVKRKCLRAITTKTK
jgi:hypothetical protein